MPKAQIQKYKYKIHKYTNTAYGEVPKRPSMWYIFEKRIVQGYQKLYFHVPKAQIQKYKYKIHKYTNTEYDEVPARPNMRYTFDEAIVQGCLLKFRTVVQGLVLAIFGNPRQFCRL